MVTRENLDYIYSKHEKGELLSKDDLQIISDYFSEAKKIEFGTNV